jgi:hypothetical protein
MARYEFVKSINIWTIAVCVVNIEGMSQNN